MSDFGKVIACLKELGLKNLSIDNFQDKLVIQKVIYLLQLKGVKTGFSYDLYVRGPYSSDLTNELYQHKRELELLKTDTLLTQKELADVHEMKELFEPIKPSILEVAATYAYFAYVKHQDPITATKNVRRIKGFYPESQIAIGISRAKQFLFKPTEKELEEMKKEHEPLERASLQDMKDWS